MISVQQAVDLGYTNASQAVLRHCKDVYMIKPNTPVDHRGITPLKRWGIYARAHPTEKATRGHCKGVCVSLPPSRRSPNGIHHKGGSDSLPPPSSRIMQRGERIVHLFKGASK